MSDNTPTVTGTLNLKIWVDCPGEHCNNFIDLMDENDTNGERLNDDGYITNQVFDTRYDWSEVEVEQVTCSECKCDFNVKGLEW